MVVCFVVVLRRGAVVTMAGAGPGLRAYDLPKGYWDWDGLKKTLQRTLQGSRDR